VTDPERLAELVEWPAERSWLVACSGGADSLALLALAARTGAHVTAGHVDHGLRPDSAAAGGYVRAVAAQLGAGVVERAADVGTGANLEARARAERYAALESMRVESGSDVVLTGHTLDDQAETVLLATLRGSGSAGLAGIAARRGTIVRPLLNLRRAQTRELCRALRLTPVDDPMNDDATFTRVWLRREVLPLLERGADRDLAPVLARQAAVLREESELLDRLAAGAIDTGAATLTTAALRELPRALTRRVLRRWLPVRVSSSTIDDVLEIIEGRAVAVTIDGGLVVRRARGAISVQPSGPAHPEPPAPVALAVPGSACFGGIEVRARVDTAAPVGWPAGDTACVLDADHVGETLTLRAPRAGERFRPFGAAAGTKTVAAARAERGVPPADRARLPVVVRADGEIVWVPGYRGGHGARVTSRTRRYCWMSVSPLTDEPVSSGRITVEPFTGDEARFA
jgi:tRNA(Ile)-lysidine synthase